VTLLISLIVYTVLVVLAFKWNTIAGFVVLFICIAALFQKPSKCEVCGTPLRKRSYVWKLEGKKKHICGNCNRSLERKVSSEAVRELDRKRTRSR